MNKIQRVNMNRMRRLISLLAIISLLITATGCKVSFFGRAEMDDIEFIRAVGVDKSTRKEGNVRLTIATQSVQPSGGGSQQKKSEIFFAEGNTIFEAIRNFRKYMYRQPFWGHLEYIVIGEEAAKDGLMEYIDYFNRDPEIRLNLKVFVAKGLRAEEVIKKGNSEDRFIFDRLDGIVENHWGHSMFNIVSLIEVMYILDSGYLSLYIPCIEMAKFSQNKQSDNEAMDIVMGGFAIFNGDKLAAYIDDKMGRGLNWLRNQIKSGVITVKSPKGHSISLEIIDSNSKLKPKIVNDELSITVKVSMTSNISGMESSESIFDGETVEYLEKQQEQVIKNEIEELIRFAQENKMDFFSTGSAVFHKYPIKWEDEYEKDWKNIFSEIEFNVIVESKINRTYDINEPNMTEGGVG